jgi:hypothetical protein
MATKKERMMVMAKGSVKFDAKRIGRCNGPVVSWPLLTFSSIAGRKARVTQV